MSLLSPVSPRNPLSSSVSIFPTGGILRPQDTIAAAPQLNTRLNNPSEVRDWRKATDQLLPACVEKISMMAAISIMDPKIEDYLMVEIINEASSSHRSLYNVFMEKAGKKYKYGFFDRVGKGFKYFFLYQCGIIPNTLETFITTILTKLRSDLVEKNGGKQLTAQLDKVLKRTTSYLADYLEAIKEYGDGKGRGCLDDYLAEKLSQPTQELCQKFSRMALSEFLPHVSFFKSWKQSLFPISLFVKIGTWIPEQIFNVVLHRFLKHKIPSVLQDLVQKGMEDRPSHLLFTFSATQSIVKQLREFQKKLDEGSPIPLPTKSVAGTEHLPELVKTALNLLQLVPYKTRAEIQAHCKQRQGLFASQIETGAIDGLRSLFATLVNPKNSEELFYNLLSLSIAPCNNPPPKTPDEWNQLNAECNALQTTMRVEARKVFATIVRHAVQEVMQGLSPEKLAQLAKSLCVEQQKKITRMVVQLRSHLPQIQEQLASPCNILEDLDRMARDIDFLDTSDLPSELQRGIAESLDPVYRYLLSLKNSIAQAKALQEQLFQDEATAKKLRIFANILEQAKQPIRTSNPLRVSPSSDMSEEIKAHLLSLQAADQRVELANKQFQDLILLKEERGFLSQFFESSHAQIRGEQTTIGIKEIRAKIDLCMIALPDAEKKKLNLAINAIIVCKTKADLDKKWNELKEQMRILLNSHRQLKETTQAQFSDQLQKDLQWVNISLQPLKAALSTAHKKLFAHSRTLSDTIDLIAQAGIEMKPPQSSSFESKVVRALGGKSSILSTVGGIAAGGFAAYFGWRKAVPILGALAGGLAGYYHRSKLRGTVVGIPAGVAAGVAIGAAANVVPYIGAIAAPVMGAFSGKQLELTVTSWASDRVFVEVMQTFDNLYDLGVQQPHVKKWALPALFALVNEAYRK